MSLSLTFIWVFGPLEFLYDLSHPGVRHVNRWTSSPPEEDATLGVEIPADFMLGDLDSLRSYLVDIGPGRPDENEGDDIDA